MKISYSFLIRWGNYSRRRNYMRKYGRWELSRTPFKKLLMGTIWKHSEIKPLYTLPNNYLNYLLYFLLQGDGASTKYETNVNVCPDKDHVSTMMVKGSGASRVGIRIGSVVEYSPLICKFLIDLLPRIGSSLE